MRSQLAIIATACLGLTSSFSTHLTKRSAIRSSLNMLELTVNYDDTITFINAEQSKAIDDLLMSPLPVGAFSIDQLMELAGYSVACAAHHHYTSRLQPDTTCEAIEIPKVLILCGPGNNGGDGLVAARHLKHFGYSINVVLPKKSKGVLFDSLVQQCKDLHIPVAAESLPKEEYVNYDLIIDALFGFSFKGPPREPFTSIILALAEVSAPPSSSSTAYVPVLSVDVPSGWTIDGPDVDASLEQAFTPSAVISLTLPKQCMRNFTGTHYIGGRFMPLTVSSTFGIILPDYGFGPNQIAEIRARPTAT
jgi:hydroxyethylthiazole kinase-like uncharacterized protein yjeF